MHEHVEQLYAAHPEAFGIAHGNRYVHGRLSLLGLLQWRQVGVIDEPPCAESDTESAQWITLVILFSYISV